MFVVAYIPALVMLAGLLLWYVMSKRQGGGGIWTEVGRIMFAFGLLVTLLTLSDDVLELGKSGHHSKH